MTIAGAERAADGAQPFGGGAATARQVPRPTARATTRGPDAAIHRLNAITAGAILVFLLLTPIPLGSNRPAFWMIWSTVVGCMAFIYGAALAWLRVQPRFHLGQFSPEIVGLLTLCAFIVVQMLPLAGWFPDLVLGNNAAGVSPRTLSLDPGSSRLVLIQFFTFGLLLFLAVQIAANRRRARRMLMGILVIIAAFAVIGLLSLTQWGDTLLGFEKQVYQGYATGTFINRNSFATFLAVGLTLGAALLVETVAERKGGTIGQFLGRFGLVIGCIIVIAAALLATGSRLGTVAGLAGAATAVVLGVLMFRGIGKAGVISVILLLAIGAVALVAMFGATLVERLVLTPGVDQTRVEAHRLIWAAILERPWFGYGAGSFPTAFQLFQAPPLSAEFVWNNSHSTYLALWFELGLIAGTIPLLIVGLLGVRAARSARDPSSTATSIAAIGTIVVFAVHSLLDFSAEIEANAFLFTVILALGAAGGASRRPKPSSS